MKEKKEKNESHKTTVALPKTQNPLPQRNQTLKPNKKVNTNPF